MTGGGFGGCIVALVPEDLVAPVEKAITTKYPSASGGLEATIHVCRASAGAGQIEK
jgi:galactokinase